MAACVALLAVAAPARGQSGADELGRRHFESGVAYLQESDYENALRAFEKAYELSGRAEILLNVATVHERLGQLREAVDSLNQYLKAAPEGEHAETVKIRIANLEKRIAEQDSAIKEPRPPLPPPPRPESRPEAPAEAPAARPPPARDRTLPYVALGLGGLAAGGAALTGILAKGEYDDAKDNCSPRCTDEDVSSGKSLALVSTVLTGVAIVGVSVGAVLLLTEPKSQEAPLNARRGPRVDVALGPAGAAAWAAWKF